jgi:hypothetical protein
MASWVNKICSYCNEKGAPACICGNTITVWDNIVGERKLEFEYRTLSDAMERISAFLGK